MTVGIYCFENLVNGKRYVGKSVNIEKRISKHVLFLRKNEDGCTLLQRAWNKYGEENFNITILSECEEHDIDDAEKYYIEKLETFMPSGYNMTMGGEGSTGFKHSDESKAKIGDSQRGENNHWYGKKLPEDVKEKLRGKRPQSSGEKNFWWGRSHTEESKKKIKESRGDLNSENNPRFGKKLSGASSSYYGVSYNKNKETWFARLTIRGKKIWVGSSDDEEECAKMYDKYVFDNELPNPLNFPEDYE